MQQSSKVYDKSRFFTVDVDGCVLNGQYEAYSILNESNESSEGVGREGNYGFFGSSDHLHACVASSSRNNYWTILNPKLLKSPQGPSSQA